MRSDLSRRMPLPAPIRAPPSRNIVADSEANGNGVIMAVAATSRMLAIVQRYLRVERGFLGDGSDTALRLRQTHTSSAIDVFSRKLVKFFPFERLGHPTLTIERQQIVAVLAVVFLEEVFRKPSLARGSTAAASSQARNYARRQNKCASRRGVRLRNRPQRRSGVNVAVVTPRA
jgi:hypothetical protein